MLAIARFNWPFYAAALGVLLMALVVIGWFPVLGSLAVAGCACFLSRMTASGSRHSCGYSF
jgi:hypothetical protein